jgi:peptidoglycan hydrolase CwlO-like protein
MKNLLYKLLLLTLLLFGSGISCTVVDTELLELVLEIKNQNEELLTEVKSLQAKSDSLINELKNSAAKQEEVLKKVTDLQAELAKVISQIGKLTEQLNSQDADLEAIKSQLADLQKKYEGILVQLEQLQKLSQILAEIEKLKSQLSELDGKYQVVVNSLAQNQQALDALKSQVSTIQTQLAQNLEKISQLTSQLGEQGADIEKILAQIEELKESFAEIKKLLANQLSEKSPLPTNGLVAWYPFNGNANDESGNNLNGSVNGAILTTDRLGVNDRAFNFSENQFIEIPNSKDKNTYPLTISIWVYVSDQATGGSIFNKYVAGSWNGYALHFVKNKNQVYPFYLNGGAIPNGIIGGYGLPEDKFVVNNVENQKWSHFIMVVENSGGKIFFNGKFIDSMEWRNTPSASSNDYTWHIGGRTGRTYPPGMPESIYFKGKIDDIGIWNRALSAEEVSKIYKGEKF